MTRRSCRIWIAALLGLLWTAAPVLAAQKDGSNPFDLATPWSYSRFAATALFVVLSFLIAFGLYFRLRLAPDRDIKSAPWPLNVFGESVIISIILSTLSFLLFFAWLYDDLQQIPFRPFPSNLGRANRHGSELVVALIALVLCALCWFVFRHRDTAAQKAR